ncbi:uncharacterized protein [Canis lupus baileyi]|uniref:uncharacterized protein n=1 Tax=Canis lupus baileyi TaxID=143281 RepID=UPI003B97B979
MVEVACSHQDSGMCGFLILNTGFMQLGVENIFDVLFSKKRKLQIRKAGPQFCIKRSRAVTSASGPGQRERRRLETPEGRGTMRPKPTVRAPEGLIQRESRFREPQDGRCGGGEAQGHAARRPPPRVPRAVAPAPGTEAQSRRFVRLQRPTHRVYLGLKACPGPGNLGEHAAVPFPWKQAWLKRFMVIDYRGFNLEQILTIEKVTGFNSAQALNART